MTVDEYKAKFKHAPADRVIKDGIIVCTRCMTNPANVHATMGMMHCDECNATNTVIKKYPEFTSDAIKDGRKEYFNTLVQPFRGGELSKEYVEAYPKEAKKQYGDKTKGAKYVYKDLPGWNNRDKSK